MSLFKTNLTTNNLNVTNLTVTNVLNTKNIFVSNTDVRNNTINNKIVSPASLKYLLQNPSSIGSTSPSAATFTTLACNSLQGDCLANDAETTQYSSIPKVITPQELKTSIRSPPVIGAGTPNIGTFTDLKCTSISGCLPTPQQVFDSTVNDHVLTPALIATSLLKPPSIGSNKAAAASFTSLNVKGNLSLSSSVPASRGGSGYSSYQKGDILVGNASNTLTKLSVGADGQFLQSDPTAPNGMSWGPFSTGSQLSSGTTQINPASNTDAINYAITNEALVPSNMPTVFANSPTIGSIAPNTGNFTNVSATNFVSNAPIPVNQGGLGVRIFKKGDILVGNNTGTLNKLSAGVDNQLLSIDNLGNLRWIDPPVSKPGGNISTPTGFTSFTLPTLTSGTTYTISKISAKSYDGTTLINLDSITFDLTINIPSASLAGTVTSSGANVTGTSTTFTTDFVVGDSLTINGVSRRIISITNDTALTLEKSFPTDQTDAAYKRGGLADNTVYYTYASSSDVFFSSRDYSSGDIIVDTPNRAQITAYYQIPLKFRCITGSPVNIGPFIDYSLHYPSKYTDCKEPQYINGSQYSIASCSARNELGTQNIDISTSQIIDITKFGPNGLEPERMLQGTVSTLGTTITGTGTTFTSDLAVGDLIGLSGSTKTARVTSIANDTSLTVNSSIDTGGSVTWTMNGLAIVTTNKYKWPSNSLYLPGNSNQNYLSTTGIPNNTPTAWTLEAWVNLGASQTNYVFGKYATTSLQAWYSGSQIGLTIQFEGYRNDVSVSYSFTFTVGTWYHVAWVYDGSRYLIYANGTLVGNTVAGNVKNGFFTDLVVGSQFPLGTIYAGNLGQISVSNPYSTGHNGYLDDVRFSNIARYVASTYTVPAAAFTVDASTIFLQNFEGLSGAAFTTGVLSALDDVSGTTYTSTGALSISPTCKFGTRSLQFIKNGSGRVTIGTLYPATGSAWTVECWFNIRSLQTTNPIIAQQTANLFAIYVDIFGILYCRLSSTGTSFNLLDVKASGITPGSWYHVAVGFTGTQYVAFLNGYLMGATTTSTAISASSFTSTFGLGCYNSIYLDGYIDEFRVSKTTRYPYPTGGSNYTATLLDAAPSAPKWTALTSTVLLPNISKFGTGSASISNNSGYSVTTSLLPYTPATIDTSSVSNFPSGLSLWLDASDASTVTTSSGNVTQWKDKSGFNRNATVSTAGTTSPTYATGAINNLGAIALSSKFMVAAGPGVISSFTICMAVKVTTMVNNMIFWNSDGGWTNTAISLNTNVVANFRYSVNNNGTGIDFNPTTWTPGLSTYVLSVVDSGTVAYVYVNGLLLGVTASTAVVINRNLATIDIGGWSGDATRTLKANVGEFQVYNNPLTNAKRSQVEQYLMTKWGIATGSSGASNGWTIECWFNCSVGNQTNPLFGNSNTLMNIINIAVNSNNGLTVQLSSDGYHWDAVNIVTINNIVALTTWNHIAISFDGSNYYVFLNGTTVSTVASSTMLNLLAFNQYLTVGSAQGVSFNGYIDEFRLSSVARYTAAFTPPTSEFSLDSNTISLQHFNVLATVSPAFTPSNGAFTTDANTMYLNHFELNQNLNLGEKSLVPVSGQNIYYRTLAANMIYYLYAYGNRTSYYILSPRCFIKTGVAPTTAAGSSANFRQLPYVFITDGSKNLYQIEWDDLQATFVNPPPYTPGNNSSLHWNSASSGYMATLDFSQTVPQTSRLAIVTARNANGVNLSNIYFRNTLFIGYASVQGLTNVSTSTVEQTYFAPLDAAQKTYTEKNGSNANVEYQLVGFFVNDLSP
jgi:hypothetical protein